MALSQIHRVAYVPAFDMGVELTYILHLRKFAEEP